MSEVNLLLFFVGFIIISIGIVCLAISRMLQLDKQKYARQQMAKLTAKKQPSVTVLVYSHNDAKNSMLVIDSLLKNTYTHFDVVVIDDRSLASDGKLLMSYVTRKNKFKKNHIALLHRRQKGTLHEAFKAGYRKSKKGEFVIALNGTEAVSKYFIKRSVALKGKNIWKVATQGDIIDELDTLSNIIASTRRIFWHKIAKAEVFTKNYFLKVNLLNSIKIPQAMYLVAAIAIMFVIFLTNYYQNSFVIIWYIWTLFVTYLLAMIWLDLTEKNMNKIKLSFAAPSALFLLPIASFIQAFSQSYKRK